MTATKVRVAGVSDVARLNGIVGGVVRNLTLDSAFSQGQLSRLARTYHNFQPKTACRGPPSRRA